jgi:hypothetical protein
VDEVTRIEIPQLLVLGDDVTGIGARFARAVAAIEAWEHSAAGAVAGSVTCDSQLALTADDWRSTLTRLAASIEDFGRSLNKTASDFWTADLHAEKRVHRSGGAAHR